MVVAAGTVPLDSELQGTFIDTPGQQLFGNMRRHGAAAADVVLLVVAADEGVGAQYALACSSPPPPSLSIPKRPSVRPDEVCVAQDGGGGGADA